MAVLFGSAGGGCARKAQLRAALDFRSCLCVIFDVPYFTLRLRGARVDGAFTIPKASLFAEAIPADRCTSFTGGRHSKRPKACTFSGPTLKHSLAYAGRPSSRISFWFPVNRFATTCSNRSVALAGSETGRTRSFLGAGADDIQSLRFRIVNLLGLKFNPTIRQNKRTSMKTSAVDRHVPLSCRKKAFHLR
jgi:hypothetical protein